MDIIPQPGEVSTARVFKISKAQAYLLVLILSVLIYFIGQLIFFINTTATTGTVCEIVTRRYRGRADVFYVCFTTSSGKEIKFRAGSNLDYSLYDTISVIYKPGAPFINRINEFKSLWLSPIFYYMIPFGILMAFVTAVFYKTRYALISFRPFRWKLIPDTRPNYF